ncbi:uncharacterized protein LOC129972192 isoform X2 [Argiope bruennichi]|uniref:uncharacterized protein LOC129972192 isoform X2 n=1 Tax=Argiope bruennichi TaxID=94029 RepID=UPI002494D986|nr:uncharacterized protein LOC129972192 isoform X2 [Argiope bruennichi]
MVELKKAAWAFIFSFALIGQCLTKPPAFVPAPQLMEQLISEAGTELMTMRQSPLAPSQFALAATRFIVMLPFLPLMMAIPGVTAVVMPLFMALQDRLTTLIPNMPNLFRPGNTGNNQQQGGSVTNLLNIFGGAGGGNQNQNAENTGNADATSETPTIFRFKRSLFKLPAPAKALNEGFREVFDFLAKTDDVLNHLTSAQADCRRQAVCRMSSIDPAIGMFIGNMLQVLKLESKIEEMDASDLTKSILKDILNAASAGLLQKNCGSVYSHCTL